MEQDEIVPFSCLISSMLLIKRSLKPIEIVNTISRLNDLGIIIDDENDEIDSLASCVEMDCNCCFKIKKQYDYDTILDNGVSVKDFLQLHSSDKINSLLLGNINSIKNNNINDNIIELRPKKKVKKLSRALVLSLFG